MHKFFIKILLIMSVVLQALADEINYETIMGADITPHLELLKTLRVEFYKDYPYLYISPGVDTEDVSYYLNSATTVLLLAHDRDKTVGMAIGLPLKDFKFKKDIFFAHERLNRVLKEEIKDYFYISEVLLTQPIKNNYQLKKDLINKMADVVRNLPAKFKKISYMAVVRETEYPINLENYVPEATQLKELNFSLFERNIPFEWPTLQADGTVKDEVNYMRLWSKDLI